MKTVCYLLSNPRSFVPPVMTSAMPQDIPRCVLITKVKRNVVKRVKDKPA